LFHSYNTRINDRPHVDLFASSLGQRSIKYKGSILWITIPEETKAITLPFHLIINYTKFCCNYLYLVWLFVCSIN